MNQTRRQFVRTLFVATQAAAIGSLLPRSLFAAEAETDALNFVVFGDWGRHGEKDQMDVATQMGIAAKEMDAKFVISVGDNFYENGVSSVADAQWQSSFEKVYAAPSLQVPWQVILGNHDYHGDCDAQLAYAKTSARWQMPTRYFQRTERLDAAATADFFYIDTTPMVKEYFSDPKTRPHVLTQDVKKQLAWLEGALAASTAQWKIVVGHHPVFSAAAAGGHGDTPELIEKILPLLKQFGVQVYFNGHDHNLQHLLADGINFIDSGAGSQFRPVTRTPQTKFAQGCSGFTAISLAAKELKLRMINDQGKEVYAAIIPQKAA